MHSIVYIGGQLDKPLPKGSIIRAEDYATHLEAQQILEKARAQAAELKAAAQQDIEQMRTERLAEIEERSRSAEREAREKGMAEGLERAYEIRVQTLDYLAGVEKRMVDLVTQSVQQIIGDFDGSELVARVIRENLDKFRHETQLVIRVCPALVESVQKQLDTTKDAMQHGVQIHVVADKELGDGDCILESEQGVLDASISSHLNALRKSLEHIVKREIAS